MTRLRARHDGHELLDAEVLDRDDLRINLRELAMLNRLPGGRAASIAAIEVLLDGQRDATILDAGTGAADIPEAIARSRRGGARRRIVAVDRRREVAELARRRVRRLDDVDVVVGDVRRLPFHDAEVDVAHASLLIHHFDPVDATGVLRELCRVARRGVVVNDLRRGLVPLAVTSATVLALARGRYTRHDGVLSARRAYRLDELDEMAAAAGLRPVWRTGSWGPRVTTAYVRNGS